MSARDEQPATVPPPAGEDDAYNATTKVGAMPAEVMAKLRAEGLLPEAEEEPEAHSPRPSTALGHKPAAQPLAPEPPPAPPSDNASKPLPMLFSTAPPANEQETSFRTLEQQIDDLDAGFAAMAKEPSPSPPGDAPPLPMIRLETPSAEIKPEALLARPPVAPPRAPPPVPPKRIPPAPPPRPTPAQSAQSDSPAFPEPPNEPLVETPIAFAAPPDLGASLPSADHVDESRASGALGEDNAVVDASPAAQPPQQEDSALRQELRAFGGGSRLTKPQQLVLVVVGVLVLVVLLFAMALLSQRR